MFVHVPHPTMQPKVQRLPNAWPFQQRGGSRQLQSVRGPALPWLDEGWHLLCVEDISGARVAKNLDLPFGRGGLIKAGGYIFRPYRRGGLLRHINSGTYLSPIRFKFEYLIHEAVWGSGFPTVEPIGYAYKKHHLGYKGIFITKEADAQPWPLYWGKATSSGHIGQVASLIKALVSWGLWAPDLNAGNFLVGADGRVLALDWDRAGWTIKLGLKRRYWARLRRSMAKLGAPEPMIVEMGRKLMDSAR